MDYRPAKPTVKLIPMSKAVTEKLLAQENSGPVKSNSISQKPTPQSPKCSQCQSDRIVVGSVSDSRRGRCFFAPAALKFWTITKSYGTKVDSYACINCGLVWMQTPPKMLEDFVRNYCDQPIS